MRLILVVIFIATLTNACEACFTPTGAWGRCVNIKKCRSVIKLLKRRPPSKVYDEIKHSHCGYEGNDPKICCEVRPSIKIPNRFIFAKPERSRNRFTTTTTTSTTTSRPVVVERHPYLQHLDHKLWEHFEIPNRFIYGNPERSRTRFTTTTTTTSRPIAVERHPNLQHLDHKFWEHVEIPNRFIYGNPERSRTRFTTTTSTTTSRPIAVERHPNRQHLDHKFWEHVEIPNRFFYGNPERSRTRFTTTTTTTSTTTSRPVAVENHPNLQLLDHELCGHVVPELRVYGGTETKLFEFPWMALLAYGSGQTDGKPDFRCSGTIINRNYVLTAAHCVTNLSDDVKLIGVRVGEHNLEEERDCESYNNGAAYICAEKPQDFAIESVYSHPDYDGTLQNDIALIRIKGQMNFRPASVRPICLPIDADSRNPGLYGVVTGWGSTERGLPNSDILLKVKLPILHASECRNAYRGNPFIKLGDRQICAGGLKGKDSCRGDSGGPLQSGVVYRGEPKMVQHGIVSFGKKNCAVEGSPGVYTSVAHYVGWILDNMSP